VLIFQPTVDSSASDKAGYVCNCISQVGQMRSCYVLTYKSGFLEGFRRWRGSILAPQRNPDLQGSCSL